MKWYPVRPAVRRAPQEEPVIRPVPCPLCTGEVMHFPGQRIPAHFTEGEASICDASNLMLEQAERVRALRLRAHP